jgi:EAL domain-containing protein (putative c-di-GMP-specific phosphodiesterase class I)
MRKRDTLARLGGDEFAVILEECPLEQAERIANNLCRTLQDFRFAWEDKVFTVGVSIGVTPLSSRISSITEVLQAADSACYTAKGLGRNRVHVHREEENQLGSSRSSNGWIAAVSHAMQEERFRLFQQIILPASGLDHQLRYEVLLRMEGADSEMVPASSFLQVVERANLSATLDRWVIRRILRWFAIHPEQVSPLHTCSINLSRHTLADQGFLEFVVSQLSQTRFPPERLCFELAESTVIGDLSETIELLEALKSIGCQIAVDDFASSPSGFIYLRHLPVDVLKIDGFLVKGAANDPVNYALVKSITEIAHTMGIVTVAKGVENASIQEALRGLELDFLQGYHIAKPAPLGSHPKHIRLADGLYHDCCIFGF